MKKDHFVIGIDFGTDSVRSVIVNTSNGDEIAASVFDYPRWKDGLYCDPSRNQFRQHPLDYLEGLETSVRDILDSAGSNARRSIRGISADTTGSTPVATNEAGVPLSLLPEFEENPNAMFVLWKDHTAVSEADAINRHAASVTPNYLQYVGGIYSSEWFWAKLLRVLKTDRQVREACYSWVEHCDWIPFLLTGGKSVSDMKRGVCSAGHKALWAADFNGLPPDEFFSSLNPLLAGFRNRLYSQTYTANQPAGYLSPEWAEKWNLSREVFVGVGAFDAHMGAVGGQIEPYYLSKVMGTSTCDMLVAPLEDMEGKLVKGICGQVPGSILPGMVGLEAGQSAFGDAYAWFRSLLAWPLKQMKIAMPDLNADILDNIIHKGISKIIPELSREAAALPLNEEDELSIDWFNGRRTPDANQFLKGAITGIRLASDAPRIFRSIVESTCFGAKAIVDRFEAEGVPVKGLIGMGGVANKSPYIMQVMADVMNMPIRIHKSEQTCAAGAAMFAAVAAGIHPKAENAMQVMGRGFANEYKPRKGRAELYHKRYKRYLETGSFLELPMHSPMR